MNDIIKQLTEHKSIRKFENRTIAPEVIDAILQAIQQAPSWINGQQMTIIRITDSEKRAVLKQLAGDQAYIKEAAEFWVFCLDFYRAHQAAELEGKAFAVADNIDLLLIGANDVGITLGTAVIAAESFGFGTVAIGGVRRDPQAIIDLLELPPYVYPISGLCIGYPAENPDLKPRLPKEAVVFENCYNANLTAEITAYNEAFSHYMEKRTNGENNTNWTSGVANFYSQPNYPGNGYNDALCALKMQGFLKNS